MLQNVHVNFYKTYPWRAAAQAAYNDRWIQDTKATLLLKTVEPEHGKRQLSQDVHVGHHGVQLLERLRRCESARSTE